MAATGGMKVRLACRNCADIKTSFAWEVENFANKHTHTRMWRLEFGDTN